MEEVGSLPQVQASSKGTDFKATYPPLSPPLNPSKTAKLLAASADS